MIDSRTLAQWRMRLLEMPKSSADFDHRCAVGWALALIDEVEQLHGNAAALRDVIIVQDRDSADWECMSCNHVARYNDKDGLEHAGDCPVGKLVLVISNEFEEV